MYPFGFGGAKNQCFGSGSELNPYPIRSVNPYPDPGGQNDPQKLKKEISCFLKASTVAWTSFSSAVNFFRFLIIKTLDPDRYLAKNAGSGSESNEYGYETLLNTCHYMVLLCVLYISSRSLYKNAGFRIRIELMRIRIRIRIQHFF
jgi:hypothetical protein